MTRRGCAWRHYPPCVVPAQAGLCTDVAASVIVNSGVNPEKLGGHDTRFSVRLSQSVRAILELNDGEWTAIAVGGHDSADRRAAR